MEVLVSPQKNAPKNLVEISNWVNLAFNSKDKDDTTSIQDQSGGRLLQVNMSLCKMMLSKKR